MISSVPHANEYATAAPHSSSALSHTTPRFLVPTRRSHLTPRSASAAGSATGLRARREPEDRAEGAAAGPAARADPAARGLAPSHLASHSSVLCAEAATDASTGNTWADLTELWDRELVDRSATYLDKGRKCFHRCHQKALATPCNFAPTQLTRMTPALRTF